MLRPKKFNFDPALIARARKTILHAPNLNVLQSIPEGGHSPLAHILQDEIKKQHLLGKLLLPDLSALKNSTIGIFSDYSGEGSGHYHVYSFLLCAWGSLATFHRKMRELRTKFGLGSKEISYKDFGKPAIQRALPAYLETLNGYVPGLLFTIAVDKRIVSLFGPQRKATLETLACQLDESGLSALKPHIAEKALRIVHTAAFFTGLLGHANQKIFWMSDHDAICANQPMHERLLALYARVLGLYTGLEFGRFGGARPFEERSTDFLDLLSAADIVAGTTGAYLTELDAVGAESVLVKPGAEKVLQWLAHHGFGMKKLNMIVKQGPDNTLLSGALEFALKAVPEGATFLPIELCR